MLKMQLSTEVIACGNTVMSSVYPEYINDIIISTIYHISYKWIYIKSYIDTHKHWSTSRFELLFSGSHIAATFEAYRCQWL